MKNMEYVNVPLSDLPLDIIVKMDAMINTSVTSIDGLPVRFHFYSGGLVIFMAKAYAYRHDCIGQIHGKSFKECIDRLQYVRINTAGVIASANYNLESSLYELIRDTLHDKPHFNIVDRRCAVCYNYTNHCAPHKGLHKHPLCNRCITKVSSCPICRQELVLADDETDYDDDASTEDGLSDVE